MSYKRLTATIIVVLPVVLGLLYALRRGNSATRDGVVCVVAGLVTTASILSADIEKVKRIYAKDTDETYPTPGPNEAPTRPQLKK